jgi:hypothetical protein
VRGTDARRGRRTAAPRCRYLRRKAGVLRCRVRFRVVVLDPEYDRAFAWLRLSGAFGIHDLPDVSPWGKTVQDLDVADRPIAPELGTGLTKRGWELAGDLHAAIWHELLLAHGDGPLARLRAQGDFEVLDTPLYEPLEVLQPPL